MANLQVRRPDVDSLRGRVGAAARALVRGPDVQGMMPPTESLGGQIISGVISSGGDPPPRNTADYLKAYSDMPWLRAALSRLSYDVAATTWRLFVPQSNGKAVRSRLIQRAHAPERANLLKAMSRDGEIEEIEEHPLLDLLDDANPVHGGMQVRRLTQIHIDDVGESFWLIERNRLELPESIWPVPPSWVRSTATPSRPFYQLQAGRWQTAVPAADMIWFSDPDPANPYGRGSGVARSLADELETDEYAATHAKAFFYNRARPDLIISPTGDETMQEADVRRFEQTWNQRLRGVWRSFLPFFMRKAVDVQQIDQNFRSQQFTQLREFERDTVFHVFGISPEILGIIRPGSSRATIGTAKRIYQQQVQVPRLELMRSVLQARLVPEYDERLVLDYASPVTEDEEQELGAAKAAPWALTVDEWRQRAGAEPLPDEQGQVHMLPVNLMPADSPGDNGNQALAGRAEGRKAGGDSRQRRPDSDAPSGADDMAIFAEAEDWNGAKDWADAIKQADPEDPPTGRLADNRMPAYRRAQLKAWSALDADLGTVTAAIAANREDEVIDAFGGIAALSAALIDPLREHGIPAFMRGARLALETLPRTQRQPIAISLNDVNPLATEWAENEAAKNVANMNESAKAAIRALIVASNEQGITAREVASMLINEDMISLLPRQADAVAKFRQRLLDDGISGDALDRRVARYSQAQLRLRATMIARTEINSALNNGQQELWQLAKRRGQLPADAKRVWIATVDERLEPICENLDGRKVGLDEAWPGGLMSPPAHPGCRCGMGVVGA